MDSRLRGNDESGCAGMTKGVGNGGGGAGTKVSYVGMTVEGMQRERKLGDRERRLI